MRLPNRIPTIDERDITPDSEVGAIFIVAKVESLDKARIEFHYPVANHTIRYLNANEHDVCQRNSYDVPV